MKNHHICWLNGDGSIPIDTIFRGMNIHLPAILGFTRYQGFDPSPNPKSRENQRRPPSSVKEEGVGRCCGRHGRHLVDGRLLKGAGKAGSAQIEHTTPGWWF